MEFHAIGFAVANVCFSLRATAPTAIALSDSCFRVCWRQSRRRAQSSSADASSAGPMISSSSSRICSAPAPSSSASDFPVCLMPSHIWTRSSEQVGSTASSAARIASLRAICSGVRSAI